MPHLGQAPIGKTETPANSYNFVGDFESEVAI